MNKTPLIIEFKGFSKSGKTTSIISLIQYLKSKNYSVSSIKHIHLENFTIDQPGKNTYKMSIAGAEPVVSLSENETSFILKRKLNLEDIFEKIQVLSKNGSTDIILCEGFYDGNYPLILCLKEGEDFHNLLKLFTQKSKFNKILESITCICGVLVSKEKQKNNLESLRSMIKATVDKFVDEIDIELKLELVEHLKNIPFIDFKNNPAEFHDLFFNLGI